MISPAGRGRSHDVSIHPVQQDYMANEMVKEELITVFNFCVRIYVGFLVFSVLHSVP